MCSYILYVWDFRGFPKHPSMDPNTMSRVSPQRVTGDPGKVFSRVCGTFLKGPHNVFSEGCFRSRVSRKCCAHSLRNAHATFWILISLHHGYLGTREVSTVLFWESCIRINWQDRTKPMCLLCSHVLSYDNMRPRILQIHLQKSHKVGVNFWSTFKHFATISTPMVETMFDQKSIVNEKGFFVVSYEIAKLIAKEGKTHSTGKPLILLGDSLTVKGNHLRFGSPVGRNSNIF